MAEFDQNKYITDYSREHYVQYALRANKEYDQDIIDGIEMMQKKGISINAFVRECIRMTLNDEKTLTDIVGERG